VERDLSQRSQRLLLVMEETKLGVGEAGREREGLDLSGSSVLEV